MSTIEITAREGEYKVGDYVERGGACYEVVGVRPHGSVDIAPADHNLVTVTLQKVKPKQTLLSL